MPARVKNADDKKPGQSSKNGYRFLKTSDIRQALHNQNEHVLVEALTALRNQLTIKATEVHIAADDERLLLVKSWLEVDAGAQDIFDLWERTNTRQLAQLSLVLSVLSCLIALLSTQYTYHAYATPIIRTLLSSQWSSKLNTYLSTTHNELILVTLKVYNNVSAFAGGRERRAVLDAFPWELKTLPKLLHMRRRSKGDDTVDILARPDIRTLFVLLLLSFIDTTTSSAVKAAFLEQRRDNLQGIFKGLSEDSHTVVRKVLECCWTGLWCDPKVKRTAKIGLFNEQTIQQILRLYERTAPEGEEQESIPADIAHHFLLAICTRPGAGVCFKDRGWYPREDEDQPVAAADEDTNRRQGARVYNKILSGVVKGLKVNEDARQQELGLRILEACPELVAGYWSAAALTLEPRLSSRWIANVAFFGLVISLPVPRASFFLPDSDLYRPSPPALATILENILPSVNIKAHLSRGLQSTSGLVQHCTALALAKCLMKYGEVIKSMDAAIEALEEDEEEGQWTRRRREVEREVARRVPEFQVIVAFGQQKTTEVQAASSAAAEPGKGQGNLTKAALLAESAQRLLWLYHEHLPSLVAETRFDVGKLLHGIQETVSETPEGAAPHPGLVALRQLHVLRLLRESEDFSWSGKTGSRGHLSILLRLYTQTNRTAMKSAVASLLRQTLSTTIAFQHDADEVDLWLRALPFTHASRTLGTSSSATSESEAVIALLDDSLQRCMKTPYRYLEELQTLCASPSGSKGDDSHISVQDPSLLPSPLLVTVLEQVQAKINGNHLSASDALAVVTYVRKLALRLASKVSNLRIVEAIARRLSTVPLDGQHYGEATCLAVREEGSLTSRYIQQLVHPALPESDEANAEVDEYLQSLQQAMSDEESDGEAFKIVDWFRSSASSMSAGQFAELVTIIERLHRPAVPVLFEYVAPGSDLVWGSQELISRLPHLGLDFNTLFIHCHTGALVDASVIAVLAKSFPTGPPVDVKRALRLIDHRLGSVDPAECRGLLGLLAAAVKKIKSAAALTQDVKQFLFKLDGVRRCCRSPLPSVTHSALEDLLSQTVDVRDVHDRELVSEFTVFWSDIIVERLETLSNDQLYTAMTWLSVMDSTQILALLDRFADNIEEGGEKVGVVLAAMMDALARSADSTDVSAIVSRLPTFLRLQAFVANSKAWEDVIAMAVDGYLPAFYDGAPPTTTASSSSLSELVAMSSHRWHAIGLDKHPLDIKPFLERESWTDLTASIVSRLTYSQSCQRQVVRDWFRSGAWQGHSVAHVVSVLRALLDACLPLTPFSDEDENTLKSLGQQALREVLGQCDAHIQSNVIFCIQTITALHPSLRSHLSSFLEGKLKKVHDGFNVTICSLAMHLDSKGSLGIAVVENGLKWAVSTLSSQFELWEEARDSLTRLRNALETSNVSAHYAESAVAVAIQNHLGDVQVLAFVQTILQQVQFKPVTVNRFLQNFIQHPKFQLLAGPANAEQANVRNAVVGVLHRLFFLHPANTCQPSHVEPLRSVYGGTLSDADRQLLSIFRLFENTRKTAISSLLIHWSPAPDSTCDSALEALQNLDAARTMRTCISFPQHYTGADDEEVRTDDRVYDPIFIMLLFSRMLAEALPTTALGWVQLFRTNVVSLLIRALSSHSEHVRTLAMSQLAGLYASLQDADMQEKPHVLQILELLKNVYSKNSPEDHPPRIPAYTTLNLAHALRGVFYPATFTYPLTARFLLQRQELDTTDVPLLYATLYSADDQWKKERAWIVRFLADGMVGRQEWRVLKRRHTWDLLASIFQSETHDQSLRRGALEFLANLTCNKASVTSLVLGSGLLSWIELQLQTLRAGEALAWVKIVENILAVIDTVKLDASTGGEWRSITSRCLLRVLESTTCDKDVFVQVVAVVLRLSATTTQPLELGQLVCSCIKRLDVMEKDAPVGRTRPPTLVLTRAPHASASLWQGADAPVLSHWGFCVESLWRASMAVEEKISSWDVLTSRLLVWRAIAGEATEVGEWARKEVIQNLG